MSRGPGKMQQWIVLELSCYSEGRTLAEMHRQYLREEDECSSAKDHARAVRHSMARALRALEKLGKIRRDGDRWLSPTAAEHDRLAKAERAREAAALAHHEAGHAVIGMAVGLAIAYACVKQHDGHVSSAHPPSSIGHVYKRGKRSYKKVTTDDQAGLDAFGNVARDNKRASEEHHAEVIMCIAGPMADANERGDITKWRAQASSSDMSIARHHRRELGDAAKSWEEYEQDTAALVNKYWPLIEAVAARLTKVSFAGAHEIDAICRRVVRRQHLKSGRVAA
jgi:hypothetical protein